MGVLCLSLLWWTADISKLDSKRTSCVMCMQHRRAEQSTHLRIPLVQFGLALSVHIYHTLNICSLPKNPAQLLVGVARRTVSFVGISKPAESVEGSGFFWNCTQELPLLKAQVNFFFFPCLVKLKILQCLGPCATLVLAPFFLTAPALATTDTYR